MLNNPDKNIETRLLSQNKVIVLNTLNTIKETGKTGYLPLLFDLLNSNPDEQIEKEITNILGTLKKKESVPVMADALQNPAYISIRKKLAAACWQNGLDFAPYLPLFVDIIINEDWETGFEAFTVIESMENFPEKSVIKKVAEKIHDALNNTTDRKKYFLQEILILIC
jgi:hypothetical protein